MTVNKRTKQSRARAENTHGWGKNQHRGSGSRGGVGNAGRGKRAGQNKPSYWGAGRHRGKHGFTPKGLPRAEHTISIRGVEDKLEKWVVNKQANKEGDSYSVDLRALGYTKLLGNGKATHKLELGIPNKTPRAEQKITAAGGAFT